MQDKIQKLAKKTISKEKSKHRSSCISKIYYTTVFKANLPVDQL